MGKLFLACVIGLTLLAPTRAEDDPIVAAIRPQLKDINKPFAMIVTLKIKAGAKEKFEALWPEAVKSTRKEPGNLIYEFNHTAGTANSYTLYEKWKNLKGLEDHLKTDVISKLLKDMGPHLDGAPDIRIMTPVAD
jgi:quinol monooxygenase YgiN